MLALPALDQNCLTVMGETDARGDGDMQ